MPGSGRCGRKRSNGESIPGHGPDFRGCTGMKPWMKPFVAQCVASITDPSYRRRLKEELADHLEALAEDLERSGLTPDAARERALEEMGDPQKLREEYRQAWLRQSNPRAVCSGRWWPGGAGWREDISWPSVCWRWRAFSMTAGHIPFRAIRNDWRCMEEPCSWSPVPLGR